MAAWHRGFPFRSPPSNGDPQLIEPSMLGVSGRTFTHVFAGCPRHIRGLFGEIANTGAWVGDPAISGYRRWNKQGTLCIAVAPRRDGVGGLGARSPRSRSRVVRGEEPARSRGGGAGIEPRLCTIGSSRARRARGGRAARRRAVLRQRCRHELPRELVGEPSFADLVRQRARVEAPAACASRTGSPSPVPARAAERGGASRWSNRSGALAISVAYMNETVDLVEKWLTFLL